MSIPKSDRVKLLATIEATEQNGLLIARKQKWVRKLDDNLYELRSKVATNIQRAIYFHVEDNQYKITHGFTKKTQKTPPKELKKGKKIRDTFLESRD
ncbi:Phage derived protein Gp49-like [Pilibacter termitis]|uniref:Phage derived protein Gp49-like n=2 Tax=Pilibacter termitis TaxID=263852 RepID=A0A1T4QZH8_9ENTE|nr:Phage derived protein Gp49-like [Pilibacter termitis]